MSLEVGQSILNLYVEQALNQDRWQSYNLGFVRQFDYGQRLPHDISIKTPIKLRKEEKYRDIMVTQSISQLHARKLQNEIMLMSSQYFSSAYSWFPHIKKANFNSKEMCDEAISVYQNVNIQNCKFGLRMVVVSCDCTLYNKGWWLFTIKFVFFYSDGKPFSSQTVEEQKDCGLQANRAQSWWISFVEWGKFC